MAIYAPFGGLIRLTAARIVTVWVETMPGEIKWHYAEPKKIGKRSTVETMQVWHVKAEWPDTARPVWNGQEEPCGSLRADDGWPEIEAELYRLNPADAEIERARFAEV